MAHEVMHIKRGQHLRPEDRDPMGWNIAGDHAINIILVQEIERTANEKVRLEWIRDCLCDWKYRGQLEENIYKTVMADQPQPQPQPDPGNQGQGEGDQNGNQNGEGGGDQNGGDQNSDQNGDSGDQNGDNGSGNTEGQGGGQSSSVGDSEDFGGGFKGDIMSTKAPEGFDKLSDAEQQQAIDEHDAQVRKDNAAAQAAGNCPQAVKDLFDLSAAPQKNWKTILADFCLSRSRSEYDWNRYNRVYSNYKIYLPDLGGVEIERAAIAIDVSGSVDRPQLQRFMVEVNDILTNCEVEETIVMQVNTKVKQVDEYLDGDEVNPEINAGGGTSFRPPFEYLEENDQEPEFLIYFTDGYCSQFAEEPDYPVLWVLNEECSYFKPPYGEIAIMDEA